MKTNQHDANHGDTQEEAAMTTDYTDYTGVFEEVVKPSNVTHQPGLIKQMGKIVPAPRKDQRDPESLEMWWSHPTRRINRG